MSEFEHLKSLVVSHKYYQNSQFTWYGELAKEMMDYLTLRNCHFAVNSHVIENGFQDRINSSLIFWGTR